ncbi:MAG: hypothetical protein ACREUC_07755, partial [Steroidobacteraceae bacterium]
CDSSTVLGGSPGRVSTGGCSCWGVSDGGGGRSYGEGTAHAPSRIAFSTIQLTADDLIPPII